MSNEIIKNITILNLNVLVLEIDRLKKGWNKIVATNNNKNPKHKS